MRGFRFTQQQPGQPQRKPLTGQTVLLLGRSNHALFIRATSGSPSKLRAFAARLTKASDELRFRAPLFSNLFADLAAVASATALKKDSDRDTREFLKRRLTGETMSSGDMLRTSRHGLAKFSQRHT